MRALLLLLSVLLPAPGFTEASTHAENVKKCRMIDRLPDENLEEIARSVGSTVEGLRSACREIRAPKPRPRPGRRGQPAPPHTPRKTPRNSSCNCGANEVCVPDYLHWKCVSNNGPDNQCTLQGDCALPGSRCVNGRCT